MPSHLSLFDLNIPGLPRTLNGVSTEDLLDPHNLGESQLVSLLHVRGRELTYLSLIADRVRELTVGNDVSYIINRNINFTNVCVGSCKFCNFKVSPGAREGVVRLTDQEIVDKTIEARMLGATEICMQGGLDPRSTLDTYVHLVDLVKGVSKDMHVHAFSPEEIRYLSRKEEMTPEEVIKELKSHGLGSMPGTAAEILVDDVRDFISPKKLSTQEWVEIVKTAHELGIPTTSTIMYGHIEETKHIATHLRVLRELQLETGGITEFVPLPFVHDNTRLYKKYGSRPGSTGMEDLALYATSRLFFWDVIPNIQASWVKTGTKFIQLLLNAGVNDLGGTLMEESISRKAGASHGIFLYEQEFIRLIRDAGKNPVQRDTLYNTVKRS